MHSATQLTYLICIPSYYIRRYTTYVCVGTEAVCIHTYRSATVFSYRGTKLRQLYAACHVSSRGDRIGAQKLISVFLICFWFSLFFAAISSVRISPSLLFFYFLILISFLILLVRCLLIRLWVLSASPWLSLLLL